MEALTPGHLYALDNFEDAGVVQTVQFIHKEKDETTLVTVKDGTTNEEVLAMLIDRMQFLQAKAPCRENAIVITKLEEALMWLNRRTAGRVFRGVEGTPKL